jgi:hypothetical protein
MADRNDFKRSVAMNCKVLKTCPAKYKQFHTGSGPEPVGWHSNQRRLRRQKQWPAMFDRPVRYDTGSDSAITGSAKKTEPFKRLEESYSAHDVGLVYLKATPVSIPCAATGASMTYCVALTSRNSSRNFCGPFQTLHPLVFRQNLNARGQDYRRKRRGRKGGLSG